MKTISAVLCAITLALAGCGAATDDEPAGSTDESLTRGPRGGGLGWSQGCYDCQKDCYDTYPRGGGPLQTCMNLCKLGGKCTKTDGTGTLRRYGY